MKFADNYTDEQARFIALTKNLARQKVEQAYEMARECYDAIVPLPHTNEKGNAVLHGCNQNMHSTAIRWLESASPFLAFLDEDTIEHLRDKYKVCARRIKNLKD
jgi:hypothetical protein